MNCIVINKKIIRNTPWCQQEENLQAVGRRVIAKEELLTPATCASDDWVARFGAIDLKIAGKKREKTSKRAKFLEKEQKA